MGGKEIRWRHEPYRYRNRKNSMGCSSTMIPSAKMNHAFPKTELPNPTRNYVPRKIIPQTQEQVNRSTEWLIKGIHCCNFVDKARKNSRRARNLLHGICVCARKCSSKAMIRIRSSDDQRIQHRMILSDRLGNAATIVDRLIHSAERKLSQGFYDGSQMNGWKEKEKKKWFISSNWMD